MHLANAHEFSVENITLDRPRRDGVHVNGPASDGLIRGVRGDSHDDNVALNAWEWKNDAPSYGPIERIVIEDVTARPKDVPAANSIRLLPGVKRFDDGTTLDCPISRHHPASHHRHPRIQALRPAQPRTRPRPRFQRRHRQDEEHPL